MSVPKTLGFLFLSGCLFSLVLLSSCEETQQEPPLLDVTSLFMSSTKDAYEACLKENPETPEVCDSLGRALEEMTALNDQLNEVYRGIKPKPLPIPDPPQPCPQGQCLELFKDITVLVFPVDMGVKDLRLVSNGKTLSKVSVDTPGQVKTLLEGKVQAFTLPATAIPDGASVTLEANTALGMQSVQIGG